NVDTVLADELREKNNNAMQYRMYARMLHRDKMKASLIGEYDVIQGIGTFLEEIGFQIDHKLCIHTLRSIENTEERIFSPSTEKEKIDLIKTLQKQLILADDIMLELCNSNNTKVRISPPVIRGAVFARHLPLMGERGADYILEFVEQYLQNLK